MASRTKTLAASLLALLILWAVEPMFGQTADLDAIVARTSRQVSAYLDQVSDVTCTEVVTRTKLAPSGKVEYHEEDTFDYFVLLQASDNDFFLSESRLAQGHPRRNTRNISLLLTNGFSTLFLIFHPYYVQGFRFTANGEETVSGQRFVRIHFEHIPGARTPLALAIRNREYPLDLGGTAWIDPETGMIARIRASLGSDMTDIGLRSLDADVQYAPVKLPGWPRSYLFPSAAIIDVESLHQRWRNVHRFTDYKRFMVGAEQKVSEDKIEKK